MLDEKWNGDGERWPTLYLFEDDFSSRTHRTHVQVFDSPSSFIWLHRQHYGLGDFLLKATGMVTPRVDLQDAL